jgi:hypothetical protein
LRGKKNHDRIRDHYDRGEPMQKVTMEFDASSVEHMQSILLELTRRGFSVNVEMKGDGKWSMAAMKQCDQAAITRHVTVEAPDRQQMNDALTALWRDNLRHGAIYGGGAI